MLGLFNFIQMIPLMYRYGKYRAIEWVEVMVIKLVLVVIILPPLAKILTDLALYQDRRKKEK